MVLRYQEMGNMLAASKTDAEELRAKCRALEAGWGSCAVYLGDTIAEIKLLG